MAEPMLLSAMHPLASRRSVFAACILAIGGMAADPDGGTDAAAAEDASVDAAPAVDATTTTPDATVASPADASEAAAVSNGPQYVLPDGAFPPYHAGNIYDLLCVQDPGVVPFDYTSVKAQYADVAGCIAFDKTGHTAAHTCFCQNCFTLQQQCDALPGCREIQKCELDIGCTNAQSCYLGGGPCVAPIDNWGTGSVNTALTQMIAACGQAASPACPSK
jgi:hypothetical protein